MIPITVSHVCRFWRDLALHTPTLWRRVTLDWRLRMWAHRIHRARACTLDIQLLPRYSPRTRRTEVLDVHAVQLYMHVVTPHIPRWRSLEIRFYSYSPYLWNAALSTCCGYTPALHATALRELSLIYPSNDDTKEFTLFNGYAPRLRRATLWGVRLTWLPSLFENLTFLDYTHHGFTHGHDAAYEVIRMLQVSARLHELRLAFPWRSSAARGRPRRPPALLLVLLHLAPRALRTLRLLARPGALPRARTALRALPDLPLLEQLQVQHAWLDTRLVFPLLHSLPRLRHLALCGAAVTGAFLRGLAEVLRARRAAGRLGVLELVGCEGVDAEAVVGLVACGTRKGMPCADALFVRDCAGVDVAALRWVRGAGMVVRVWVHGTEIALGRA
ncbi:hypothetical protein B0H21DRAFT_777083 [Amylocystis lapponica]|nr:hypothetical protein B0H21DRAFT_777083 [Amylocystis lapponica]